MRVNEQDYRRTIELGDSHLEVDDGHEDYKSETHYAYMHMDEDVAKILGREVEAFVYEVEKEHINSHELHLTWMVKMMMNPIMMRRMWMMTPK